MENIPGLKAEIEITGNLGNLEIETQKPDTGMSKVTGDFLKRGIEKNPMTGGVLAMIGAIQKMTGEVTVNHKNTPEMIKRIKNMRGGALVKIKNSTLGGALQTEINMRTGRGVIVNRERSHPEI